MFQRVPLREALATRGSQSKWPTQAQPGRLEPICLPEFTPGFSFSPGEPVFTMGSCFARNVEIFLRARGFRVPGLEFDLPREEIYTGTVTVPAVLNKYTPLSMLNEIEFVASDDSDGSKYLVDVGNGMVLDEQLHTDKPVTLARGLERRQQLRSFFRQCLDDCRVVILTLGLAEAWWDSENEVYLNETPNRLAIQRHPKRFFFEVLSPAKLIEGTERLVSAIYNTGRKDKKMLLTVSPVPFVRSFSGNDALTANCYSKSALRVAAECVVRNNPWIDYFPSYESVTLTNRERAWEGDFIHVQSGMVAANVGRMIDAYSAAAVAA